MGGRAILREISTLTAIPATENNYHFRGLLAFVSNSLNYGTYHITTVAFNIYSSFTHLLVFNSFCVSLRICKLTGVMRMGIQGALPVVYPHGTAEA